MLSEVRELFQKVETPVKNIFDGTFGRGGHTRALLSDWPEATVHAFDHDLVAIESGRSSFANEISAGRLKLYHSAFGEFEAFLASGEFDAILLDLGVSSPQVDEAERGFSFYHDGPLDMRMDQRIKMTAADIISNYSDADLVSLFRDLGEVEKPNRVVRAIVQDRQTLEFKTTKQLADMIERVDGWHKKGFHPATQYFMALRIRVNNELDHLMLALPKLLERLSLGGIMGVITFHSLEDRIVKQLYKSMDAKGRLCPNRALPATDAEIKLNPRSRSARLRGFLRSDPKPKNKYWQHSKIKGEPPEEPIEESEEMPE
jgi:16S rRNA (cytosine1402-N4)-methyltransferase